MAEGKISKVYQHFADEDNSWNNNILSANKSDYFEGEVIPHVFVYKASSQTPLVNGQTYSFTITYNYYQQNTDAGGFAFITQYDASRTGLPDLPGTSSALPAEDDLFDNDGGFTSLNGFDGFYTVDADITDVSDVTYTGTGTLDGNVTVTFTYTGETTTSGFAEIYYGLYIAEPGRVPPQGQGETNGASAWSGGSLQTTVTVGGSGATSIQLAPSAIIDGEISGVKFEDTDQDGVRDAGEALLSGWTIVLDKDADPTNGFIAQDVTDANGFYSFSVTPDADKFDGQADNDGYFVYEVQQSGWTQTAPAGGSYGPLVISADGTTQYLNQDFGNVVVPPPDFDVNINKVTYSNGDVADAGDNVTILAGSDVVWRYLISSPDLALSASDIDFVSDNQGVTPVAVESGGFNVGDTDADEILDTNETWVYEANGTAGMGAYINVGTFEATVTNAGGSTTSSDSDPSSYTGVTTGINVVKTADQTAFAGPGTATYTYEVTNTGTIALSGVTVTDDAFTAGDTGDDFSPTFTGGDTNMNGMLDLAETWTYSATYNVTQGDVDAGTALTNVATAEGTFTDIFGNSDTATDNDDETLTFTQNPALTIDKVVTGVDTAGDGILNAVGDIIDYNIVVTNTGNQTLTNVVVQDPLTGTDVNVGTLAPGAVSETAAQYAITQADIDSNGGGDGDIDNTATADSDQTDPEEDSEEVPLTQNPALTILKTASSVDDNNDNGLNDAGDQINYTITVTNTGNQTLTNVGVSDPLLGGTLATIATLAVGASQDVLGSYIITQDDVDNNGGGDGDIDNTACVISDQTPEVCDDEDVPLDLDPAIQIVKKTNGAADANQLIQAGDPVEWTYEVTNTGNVTLDNVAVVDDAGTPGNTGDDITATFASGDTNGNNKLDVGETWLFEGSGVAVSGSYENTATATADDPADQEVSDTDVDGYFGTTPPVTIVGSPRFNFPADVNKIQPKVNPQNSFTLNPDGTIYWDIFTSDYANAKIDPASAGSAYAGFDVEIVEIWNNGSQATWRIYVTNESDTPVALVNSTDIVTYNTILTATSDRDKLDLTNADPIIGNFNDFNNIDNTLDKLAVNGFDTGIDDVNDNNGTIDTSDLSDKVWGSTNLTGTLDNETPTLNPINGQGGADLIYGVNQPNGTVETLNGDAGNDALTGRRGDDALNGGDGNDFLYGGLGSDTLNGGAGNDTLVGSYGIDEMTGGTGNDIFVLEPGAFDFITDFEEAGDDDTILFGDFSTGHGAVQPTAAQFFAGTDLALAPGTAIFLFETDTGLLFFDEDMAGTGSSPTLIAVLDPGATLDASDILFDDDLIA